MQTLTKKQYLALKAPSEGDFLAARERLLAALPEDCQLTLPAMQSLYPVLHAADYRVTVTLCPGPRGTDVVRVEPGDTTGQLAGACLDIGSTTMQLELVDLVSGRTLAEAACTNSQTQFGTNILDRILAVKEDRENLHTLQALTLADIDFEKSTITINKSYQRINREDVITTPKTPKSNRVVTMPNVLAECLKAYISQCYDLDEENRIFPYTKYFLTHEMQRGCKKSGVKKIRIHDIRHSHASLLVEMGFSPLLIAERLGHERVQTTMETYSHLYPNKQVEVANRLDSL